MMRVNHECLFVGLLAAMWPALIAFARAYAPAIVFPFAVVIGAIGYNLEGAVSDKSTPWKESVHDRREQRKMDGEEGFQVPNTIFDRNKKSS